MKAEKNEKFKKLFYSFDFLIPQGYDAHSCRLVRPGGGSQLTNDQTVPQHQ